MIFLIKVHINGDDKLNNNNLITKTGLKERGWTESLIKRFFPVPTKEAPNPYYRSVGAPMKLYDLDKVGSIESSPNFVQAKIVAEKRKDAGIKSAEKKRKTTIKWAETLPNPDIPVYSKKKLYKLACQHYNDLWLLRGCIDKRADVRQSTDFLNRISVNYLRHALSPYEERLIATRGMVGASEARQIIRERILATIAVKYPCLSNECERQTLKFDLEY